MTVVVRPAVAGDAPGIARVHIAAWRETYARLLPAGALDDLDPVARAGRWVEILEAGRTDVAVAEAEGAIVGWASASTGRDADAPRDRELEGIYLLADRYGTGAGQRLLDALIGDRPAYLWSAADNPRAQAFYVKNGFHDDGTRSEYPLAGHPVTIARFVR